MKNILIFAGIAGLAAAVAIYFVTEYEKTSFDQDGAFEADGEGYVTDADIAAYEMRENTGPAVAVDDDFKPAY